jgi:hypothetical protein
MYKINWQLLSKNPNAIHLLEENLDKIKWHIFSGNPNSIYLLEKNQDKINWNNISSNPSIFTYDYEKIKIHMKNTFGEELMKNRFNPKYMHKWNKDWGFDDCITFYDL